MKIRDDLRVFFQYLVPKLAKDGRVKLTVFRGRKSIEVEVPVPPDGNFVIPFLMGKYPRYFICGPMVFMPASQDLMRRLDNVVWASMLTMIRSPLLARAMDHPAFEGEEIVTLGYGLLPHKTSKGYRLPPFSVVTHVNGTAVRNLAHLVELIRDAKDEFLDGRSGRQQSAGGFPPAGDSRRHRRDPFRRRSAQAVLRRFGKVWHKAK